MNNYAVLGDPEMGGYLRKALSKHGMSVLNEEELEIQDEWDTKRWFSRNTPDGVFISIGLNGQTSVANFSFTVGGTYNVIRAAAGNVKRLLLISAFPTGEFFLMARLAELYRHEKQVRFLNVVRSTTEQPSAFAERCVLVMRDVLAEKKEDAHSSEGADQRREVRDQVVPQSEGSEQHGTPVKPVLEVSVQAATGEAPRDLRPERAPAGSQAPEGAHHDNPGSI